MLFRIQIFAAVCLVGKVLCESMWLTYVCNPETHDYSVVNPNSSHYHYALVEGSGDEDCSYSFSADYKTMNISTCEGKLRNVVLSDGPIPTNNGTVVGGNQMHSYMISCELDAHIGLAEVDIEAGVDREIIRQEDNEIGGKWTHTYGVSCDVDIHVIQIGLMKIEVEVSVVDSPDFSDAEVEVSIRDLQDVEGYTIMTIGYPLTVELTGPAGSEMLPKQCVAYSGKVSAASSNKTIIESGCSVDSTLIFDFEENLGSWFDRGLELPSGTLLSSEGEETGEEDSQPVLATHMYAFRFYNSRKVVVHCDVQLCASDSSDCDLACS